MTAPPSVIVPIRWHERKVYLIDQTRLPLEYGEVEIASAEEMARAIETMVVRGAPAIGVSAAYAMVLGAGEIVTDSVPALRSGLETVAARLRRTRPTAVNLFWAIDRMLETARETDGDVTRVRLALLETARAIQEMDVSTCRAIGALGLAALPETPGKLRLLTHCNTGALATAGYGTALGVIRSAWSAGRLQRVYADETRPRLQGARLTAWECAREGIPVTLLADSAAAHCLKQKMIDAVIVGADRIAANGDTANKIGTYSLALVARAHDVPFYVAAPLSTVDFSLPDGTGIPIEERDGSEIYRIGTTRICPEGVDFYNPAFDVTPAGAITAIITEKGVVKPADLPSLQDS